jgi:hypothetical protein
VKRPPAYLCDHPNWVHRRQPNCKRRTTKVCEACGVPTCGVHLRLPNRDGKLYCQRWRCRDRRVKAVLSA